MNKNLSLPICLLVFLICFSCEKPTHSLEENTTLSFSEKSDEDLRTKFSHWRSYDPSLSSSSEVEMLLSSLDEAAWLVDALDEDERVKGKTILWSAAESSLQKTGQVAFVIPVFNSRLAPIAFVILQLEDGHISDYQIQDLQNTSSRQIQQSFFVEKINSNSFGKEFGNELKVNLTEDASKDVCFDVSYLIITNIEWYQCLGVDCAYGGAYLGTSTNFTINSEIRCFETFTINTNTIRFDNNNNSNGTGNGNGNGNNPNLNPDPSIVIPCIPFDDLYNNGNGNFDNLSIDGVDISFQFDLYGHNSNSTFDFNFAVPNFNINVDLGTAIISADAAVEAFNIAIQHATADFYNEVYEQYGQPYHTNGLMNQLIAQQLFLQVFENTFESIFHENVQSSEPSINISLTGGTDNPDIPNASIDCF